VRLAIEPLATPRALATTQANEQHMTKATITLATTKPASKAIAAKAAKTIAAAKPAKPAKQTAGKAKPAEIILPNGQANEPRTWLTKLAAERGKSPKLVRAMLRRHGHNAPYSEQNPALRELLGLPKLAAAKAAKPAGKPASKRSKH
jgi:hypothetical protein